MHSPVLAFLGSGWLSAIAAEVRLGRVEAAVASGADLAFRVLVEVMSSVDVEAAAAFVAFFGAMIWSNVRRGKSTLGE